MARFFLHAVGRDRPGIVSALAGALEGLGCNLEDSRMTLLRGQFAVMLVLDAPGITESSRIEAALAPVAIELDLVVAVRPLGDEEPGGGAGGGDEEPVVLAVSVHGADHPGIVARITGEVARAGGNIVDLATRVVDGGSGYVLLISVELEPGPTGDELAKRLERAAKELGVHCSVAAGDADVL